MFPTKPKYQMISGDVTNSMDTEERFRRPKNRGKKCVIDTILHSGRYDGHAVPNIMPRGSWHSKDQVIKSF